MTGQEAYNKWIMAKDVDEFRRVELAEMLDCLVKYVDELKAAQQALAPDVAECRSSYHGAFMIVYRHCPVCGANRNAGEA